MVNEFGKYVDASG